MADAADENPSWFVLPHPTGPEKKKPRVEGETSLCSTAQAAAVAKVLGDDNLLREIILRVGFPTTLVRAALVCKRWLAHAADPKFLSLFRELHPPRLLGCYITQESPFSEQRAPVFVPILPQPPELAPVIRRLESYNFGTHEIMHCRDGNVFAKHGPEWTHGVHRPLFAEEGVRVVPPLPRVQGRNIALSSQIISKEEGSSLSYMYLLEEAAEAGEYKTHMFMLRDSKWQMHASATISGALRLCPIAKHISHNKIYLSSALSDITVFDFMAPSFSKIQLPQGVKPHYLKAMLSPADDPSSVYLVHVDEFQLRISLHKGGNWLLVDTICLRQMFSTLGITLEDEGIANVQIRQAGDNCQFVFLQMGQCIFYLDIKCRTLCKVYENTVNGRDFCSIHPFMMIWPPKFPDVLQSWMTLPEMPCEEERSYMMIWPPI